ncbi:hypothetical protein F5Y17DRAFT_470346 [Xylariaceae sp. FL0594]|nr:hypothetical protein F5Y17DRAFT_470346 [Xylariaceae sp. FL0594]
MMIARAVILATLLASASAQSVSDCATGCVSGVLANTAAMGCANGDTHCVCSQADIFHDGIRDCIAGACPQDVSQTPLAISYGDSQCATSLSDTASPVLSPAGAPASSSQDAPATAPAAVATNVPLSSPVSTSTVSTGSPSSTAEEPQTTITDIPADGSQPSSTSPKTSTTGLSTAVKAGIGAGAGVAALAAIIVTVCACLRRRRGRKATNPARSLKISEPMADYAVRQPEPVRSMPPSGGKAAYADTMIQPTSPTSTYSYSSELESNARRYEDLMPRTQPRTMV